jgi:hypothetical protein
MKKTSIITIMAALLIALVGCDKIDPDNTLKPVNPTGGGDVEGGNKTVLIKDFTGARCVNCPAAAETAHALQHQLGEDRVFVMSVHAGGLAQPAGQFPDFLTEEGTAWYNNHDSNPLFSVDNVSLTDGNTLYVDQIDAPVAAALAEEQSFEIEPTVAFDETSRDLTVNVSLVSLVQQSGQFNVTVCLVEDNIIGWQITPEGINREYVFRNVFRGTLNGANGEMVSDGDLAPQAELACSCTGTLSPDFNADECYVLAYVSGANGKILQTAMKKVK